MPNIYILNESTISKLSAHKPRWKNKAIRFSDDEIKEVNEAFRIMKTKHPDLKTDRDLILNWIRGGTLTKELDKQTMQITINKIQSPRGLACRYICYKDNQFQCGKRLKRRMKYDAISPDPKDTLQHCSICGGPFNRDVKFK